MQVNSRGSVRRTKEEWRGIFARWEESGVGVAEFCKGQEIALSTFRRWQERLRGSEQRQEFVPLVSVGPSSPANASCWVMEVELPNGAKLRLKG